MSRVADGNVFDAMTHLFSIPETLEKLVFNSRSNDQTNENRGVGSMPVDILDSPKEYVFYIDVPGLSKSDIQFAPCTYTTIIHEIYSWKGSALLSQCQDVPHITNYVDYAELMGQSDVFQIQDVTWLGQIVTVEDERTLVIKSGGKRKREDGEEEEEEEGCKYVRLERRGSQKLMRKFRLPEDANVGAISAKCENGVLTVIVEKLPPPPKPKKVEVTVS